MQHVILVHESRFGRFLFYHILPNEGGVRYLRIIRSMSEMVPVVPYIRTVMVDRESKATQCFQGSLPDSGLIFFCFQV